MSNLICHYCSTPADEESTVWIMGEPMCDKCKKVYDE